MGWRPRVTRSRRDEGETRKSDAARRGDEQAGGRRRLDGDARVRAAVRAAVRRMRLLPAFAVDRRVAGTGGLRSVDLDESHARDGAHVGEQSCAGARYHRTTDRRRERAQQHREDREPCGRALPMTSHVGRRKGAGRRSRRFLRKRARLELISVTYSGFRASALDRPPIARRAEERAAHRRRRNHRPRAAGPRLTLLMGRVTVRRTRQHRGHRSAAVPLLRVRRRRVAAAAGRTGEGDDQRAAL